MSEDMADSVSDAVPEALATLVRNPFSEADLQGMRAIISGPGTVPRVGGTPVKEHVEHCLWQLLRFTHLARRGHPLRMLQFGLNLGRVQELLGSFGGKAAWWQAFEGPVQKGDLDRVDAMVLLYLSLLAISPPPEQFLDRV